MSNIVAFCQNLLHNHALYRSNIQVGVSWHFEVSLSGSQCDLFQVLVILYILTRFRTIDSGWSEFLCSENVLPLAFTIAALQSETFAEFTSQVHLYFNAHLFSNKWNCCRHINDSTIGMYFQSPRTRAYIIYRTIRVCNLRN